MSKINEKLNKTMEKISSSKILMFFDQLFFRIQNNSVLPVGGQLAYFLVLSVFPFIMVFLNIISKTSFVDKDVIYSAIYYLPVEVQNLILGFVEEVVTSSSQGLLSFAIILAIWSASSGIRAVMRGINNAYGKKETRSFLSLAIISVLFTIAILVLLIIVFATLVFGELIGQVIFKELGLDHLFASLWSKFRLVIPVFFMIFTFALLYKVSPSSKNKIKFKSTLPGAIFTTLGWIVISILFSYYVNNFANYTLTYGSLVGIIILLIWLYISSVIILIGGEINATLQYFNESGYEINENMSLIYSLIK
ncbi:MAG TPA: YihY/virulence factor BrkB family protein [Tissierellaceae bacterium]